MFMSERTYHLSIKEMTVFLHGLEEVMSPFKTHVQRYLLLLEKMNEKCFVVSSTGMQAIMQSVAIFPDLSEACVKTLEGFSDLSETQAQVLEAAQDINNDIAEINEGYTSLLRQLIESKVAE